MSTYAIFIGLLAIVACSDSSAPRKGSSVQNSDNVAGTNLTTSTSTASSTSTDTGTTTTGTDTVVDANAGTDTGTGTTVASLTCDSSMHFNVALSLDNSNSLSQADSNRISDAAKAFVNGASQLVARSNVRFNIAIVSFNGQSTVGQNGWVDVSTAVGINKIWSDIADVTGDQHAGNSFTNAVSTVSTLFASKPIGSVKERNSWVLISDKDAIGGDRDALSSMESLVDTRKISIVTVGVGNSSFDFLSSMALPRVGVVDAQYVGHFSKVDAFSGLLPLLNQAFSHISSVCP